MFNCTQVCTRTYTYSFQIRLMFLSFYLKIIGRAAMQAQMFAFKYA